MIRLQAEPGGGRPSTPFSLGPLLRHPGPVRPGLGQAGGVRPRRPHRSPHARLESLDASRGRRAALSIARARPVERCADPALCAGPRSSWRASAWSASWTRPQVLRRGRAPAPGDLDEGLRRGQRSRDGSAGCGSQVPVGRPRRPRRGAPRKAGPFSRTVSWDQQELDQPPACSGSATFEFTAGEALPVVLRPAKGRLAEGLPGPGYGFVLQSLFATQGPNRNAGDRADTTPLRVEARAVRAARRPSPRTLRAGRDRVPRPGARGEAPKVGVSSRSGERARGWTRTWWRSSSATRKGHALGAAGRSTSARARGASAASAWWAAAGR